MGFDLNNNKLTASGGVVVTTDIGNVVMKMATNGTLTRFNVGQTMFRAGSTNTSTWVVMGTDTWSAAPVWETTDVNVGSCYNPANAVFTAPVNGLYLLSAHAYTYIITAGGYTHPMFWVNGAATARRPSSGGLHRIRGHGIAAGYQVDNNITEVISLLAGDYVEFRNYCGGQVQHLPSHGRYEGYLLF